jgi:hypothetical protein
MNKMQKIFLLIAVFALPFVSVHAQTKKKKKTPTQKTTFNKKKSTKPSAKTKAKASTSHTTTATRKPVVKRELPKSVSDTPQSKVVTVTSAFKPSLRNAAKINFTAATPIADTSHMALLSYRVPAQNLFFSYQPVPIRPLALFIDTGYTWTNYQYLKLGYGNYSTPYIEAGFSFGDGKKSATAIHAKHTSSTGSLPFQSFGKTGLDVTGVYNTSNGLEWSGKAFYNNSVQYLYGYQPSTLVYTKDQLKQEFNTIGVVAGVQNKVPNEYGITYHPSIAASFFSDARHATEFDFVGKVPINKSFGKMFAFDLSFTADITSYTDTAIKAKNNLFYLNPTLQFKTPNFSLNAGLQPSWDNQVSTILPNITAEAKLKDERFVLQAGWVGYFQKNTYQSLVAFNPFIQHPTGLINTRIDEKFGGFKGSAGKHFTYNAKLSFMQFKGQPLFTNDLVDGKSFLVLYEPDLQALRIHGEVGYTVQEKFSVLASATFNQFTKLSVYDRAYGLSPVELTGTFRWKVLKDLHFKSDIFFWDGARYQSKSLQTQKLDPALDLNAGVEYTVVKRVNLWLQINNLLNSHYQRWSQYDVLGFNVLAGFVYSFR